ncbi:MAG: MEDS domain-containing protein [Dehalobacterium sp.]
MELIDLMRSIDSGEHLTYINYESDKRIDYFGAFLAVGIERNEKCIYWVEDTSPEKIIKNLEYFNIDTNDCFERGQLIIGPAKDFYLENGIFSIELVMKKWLMLLLDAKKDGFVGIRLIGETGWLTHGKMFDKFMEYESEFNEKNSGTDFTAICQYKVDKCTTEMIKWILQNHRYVLYDNGKDVSLLSCPELLYSDTMVKFLHESIRDRVILNQTCRHLDYINKLTSQVLFQQGPQNTVEQAIKYLAHEYGAETALSIAFDKDTQKVRFVCCHGIEMNQVIGSIAGPMTNTLYEYACGVSPSEIESPGKTGSILSEIWRQRDIQHLVVIPTKNGSSIIGLTFFGWVRNVSLGNMEMLNYFVNAVNIKLDYHYLQEKAYEKKKMTENLKDLGTLTSGIAHEFNNILAVILGNCQLIQLKLQDKELSRFLSEISNAAGDAAQIVQRIQSYSRPKTTYRRKNIEMNSVINSALEFTRTKWDNELVAKGLKLRVETNLMSQKIVYGNETELREVFVNLILNAVDAMPQGGLLSISSEDVGNKVVISITDTGVGMTEEEMSMIFNPFFSTKNEHGTGLGLTISKNIITSHDGEITVKSEKERGTKFIIVLPEGVCPELKNSTTSLPDTRSLNICVVDDDEQVLNSIQGQLEALGHIVFSFKEPSAFLDSNKVHIADLVISDIAMPGINGIDLAKSIKLRNSKLPVILITGWFEDSLRLEAMENADEILYKPFTLYELQHHIERFS